MLEDFLEPMLLESGLPTCIEWLKKKLAQLQLQTQQMASKKKSPFKGEAALLQYLLPCYLRLLENTKLEGRGLVFLYQAVVNLLMFYRNNLKEKQIESHYHSHSCEIDVCLMTSRQRTWCDQNKVLLFILLIVSIFFFFQKLIILSSSFADFATVGRLCGQWLQDI